MTAGNYRVHREVSYPDYPKSQFVFDAAVVAVTETEWLSILSIGGTYDGPTDVAAAKDYRIEWSSDGRTLFEKGSVMLELRSGRSIRSEWSSSIVPTSQRLRTLPAAGQVVNVTYSPFKLEKNDEMSYQWEGTVRSRPKRGSKGS